MKIKSFFSILILIISILMISSCSQTPTTPLIENKTSDTSFNASTKSFLTLSVNSNVVEMPLLAGQNTKAGVVSLQRQADKIIVTFSCFSGWAMSETHLAVTATKNEIPVNKSGNPKVGNFPYSSQHPVPVSQYTYTIPAVNLPVSQGIFVAAHATLLKVEAPVVNLAAIELLLPPSTVFFYLTDNRSSYISTYIFGDNVLAKFGAENSAYHVYPGYCVDIEHVIYLYSAYNMVPISSYTSNLDTLARLVDKPQNFDLVNYIINHDYSSLGASGMEIQAAIWTIIDNNIEMETVTWNPNIVNAIISDAIANGEGYVPDPDGVIAIILDPGTDTNRAQTTIVSVPIQPVFPTSIVIPPVSSVTGSESAWAEGQKFDGGNWSMYSKITLN